MTMYEICTHEKSIHPRQSFNHANVSKMIKWNFMNVKRIKERKVNLQTRMSMSVHSNMRCINVNIYVEIIDGCLPSLLFLYISLLCIRQRV